MTYCCVARPLDFTEIFSLDYNMEFLPKGYLNGQFIKITKTDYLLQNIWSFAISIQLHPK